MNEIYYRVKKSLIMQKVEDEFLLIDPATDKLYVFNETGERIIKYLKKKRKIDDIVSHIIGIYDVKKSVVKKDISNFTDKNVNSIFEIVI